MRARLRTHEDALAGNGQSDELHRVIRGLYDAALEPELWQSSLDRLGDLLGGCAIGTSVQSQSGGSRWLAHARLDPDYAEILAAQYRDAPSNPVVAVVGRLPTARAFARTAVKEDSAYFRSGLYHDVFHPQGLVHAAVACAYRSADVFVPIGIFRRAGQGEFGDHEFSILALVLPHLEKALQIFLRLQTAETSDHGVDKALDHLPVGVIFVGTDARVHKLNRTAETILRAEDGLSLRDGRLCVASPDDERALSALISSALGFVTGGCYGAGGWLAVSRQSMARPLAVLVAPLPGSEALLGNECGAIVFVSDPERQVSPGAGALMALFGLTHTQAELTGLLVKGADLNEAAALLGITTNTARTHLKAALARTSTGRQAELVRLVLSSVAQLSDGLGPHKAKDLGATRRPLP